MGNLFFLSYSEFHSAKMFLKLAGGARVERNHPFIVEQMLKARAISGRSAFMSEDELKR